MAIARYDLSVRFYELDPYGHVNHATYLQYFEAARVAWLDQVGQGLDRLQAEGTNLVVVALATRFVTPAVLSDTLHIETGLVTAQRVRAQWAQWAWRDEELIACQRVNFATVGPGGRPKRMPAELADVMAGFRIDADATVDEDRLAALPALKL